MNFQLTEDQQGYRALTRGLVDEQISPRATSVDVLGSFPWENFRAMAGAGLSGLFIPPEYGGQGQGLLTLCLVVEELARGCPSTAAVLMANTLATYPIALAGTERQKQHYLSLIARGRLQGCFALTERQAGSDAGAVQTTAMPVAGGYRLNGTKCFIGNGMMADVCIIVARTDPSRGARGLTAFLVEKSTPGLSVGKIERKMGLRGTNTVELILKDCPVSTESLLGELNRGFHLAMQNLDVSRPTTGAQAIGMAQAALEEAIKHSKQRVQFGQPIAGFQAIQFMLADMATELEAARLLVYRVASLKDQGAVRLTKEAAMAKVFATEMAHGVVDRALQIHGGYGYMKDHPVERLYRDQRVTEIYEGTSEIQRLVIARELSR